MLDEDLDNFLHRAAAATGDPPPHATGDVAGAVRRRHARRQRVRRMAMTATATATACVLVVGMVVRWPLPGVGDDPHVAVKPEIPDAGPAIDVDAVRREIAQLQREAEISETAVRLTLDRPRIDATARPPSSASPVGDPLMELEWQREQAALALVHQGDRLANDLDLPGPAALAYRRASETFPGTHWASIARTRLQTP